jgi:hypothetical protein
VQVFTFGSLSFITTVNRVIDVIGFTPPGPPGDLFISGVLGGGGGGGRDLLERVTE